MANELTVADRAIKYILDRIQHDANLRWYMINTQAHALLVEAEAKRLGVSSDELMSDRLDWKGEGKGIPDVRRYRDLLDENNIDY